MPRKSAQAREQEQQGQGTPDAIATREPGDEAEREPLPPQRGWKHDNAAGVERLYYTDTDQGIYEAWLKFRDGKPSEAVRSYMKDNGYRWRADAPSGGRWSDVKGAWVRPTNYQALSQDRLHHERVFTEVDGPTAF